MNSPSRREGSSCYSLLALGTRLSAVTITMLVVEALAYRPTPHLDGSEYWIVHYGTGFAGFD